MRNSDEVDGVNLIVKLSNSTGIDPESMDPLHLKLQYFSNNGGVHVLKELQRRGVTRENVKLLLIGLETVMFAIAEEEQKRGLPVTSITNTHDYGRGL